MSQPEMTINELGTKFWLLNGEYHREDGPAIENANGTRCWYLNGKYHREDGPAVEYPDGSKMWYLNGKYHREDGPAIEHPDGEKLWFLNDKEVPWQEVFKKANDPEIELRILSFVDNLST